MDLVVATKNKDKVREIKAILAPDLSGVKIFSLVDFPEIPNIKETGQTFKENALKKAKIVAKKLRKLTLADDSGLEVDYLKGAPGVKSARFAGPQAGSHELCAKLLRLMKGVPMSKRGARFVCNVAITTPLEKVFVVEGVRKGRISFKEQGRHGFGYDPVFIPSGYNRTFAELSPGVKNQISHRALALKKAKKLLVNLL